jgi:hypothetical protein
MTDLTRAAGEFEAAQGGGWAAEDQDVGAHEALVRKVYELAGACSPRAMAEAYERLEKKPEP